MMIHKTALALTGAGLLTATSAIAGWSQEIDLNSYAHGTILNGMDLGNITIDGDNFHNNYDHVVVFDTTLSGTRDPDLEGPSGSGGSWTRGNLRQAGEVLGNVLILQEMDRRFAGYTDASQSAVKRPDDEGRRRGGSKPGAGEITFDFNRGVQSFGFTLIDVEETGEFNNQTGHFALFSDGSNSVKVAFADLIDSNSIYYDPSIAFGDHSANRIEALTAAELGLKEIKHAKINLGGSGGVGQVNVTGVPSPTAAIAGLALMGVLLGRRGRRKPLEA